MLKRIRDHILDICAVVFTFAVAPMAVHRQRLWHLLWTSWRRRRPIREIILCNECERDHHIHGRDCRCITPWCMCTADHKHPHLDVTV